MARRKAGRALGKLISVIFVLLLLVAVGGAFFYFFNNPSGSASLYVEYSGTRLVNDATIYFQHNEKAEFVIIGNTDYTVKIIPNIEHCFNFYVNGDPSPFSWEPDLTAGFDIEFGENSFTIDFRGLTMRNILMSVWGDDFNIHSPVQYPNEAYFTMIVQTLDGKAGVYFHFGLHYSIEHILLFPWSIVI